MVPPEHTTLRAPEDAAGQRADRFLAEGIGTLSRSRVKALIEAGRVSRDGTPLREPAEPVRAGSLYRLDLPAPVSARPEPQPIPFALLFEDEHLLVLDKPAGHRAPAGPRHLRRHGGGQDGDGAGAALRRLRRPQP